MSYRMDTIPCWLKPFFLFYSYLLGCCAFVGFTLLHKTCRIRFEGRENLRGHSNFIFSAWHQILPSYFVAFTHHDTPQAWLSHPLWSMKPIVIHMGWVGIHHIIFGSAGHSGKEAMDRLVLHLKEGCSTLINPDGPAGPPRVMKKGVLHLALATGVPVVPMRIETGACLPLKTWDRKRIPLPFTTLTVIYGKPIKVTEDNLKQAEQNIFDAMSS